MLHSLRRQRAVLQSMPCTVDVSNATEQYYRVMLQSMVCYRALLQSMPCTVDASNGTKSAPAMLSTGMPHTVDVLSRDRAVLRGMRRKNAQWCPLGNYKSHE